MFKSPEAPKVADISPSVTSTPRSLEAVQDQNAHRDVTFSVDKDEKDKVETLLPMKEMPANGTLNNSTVASVDPTAAFSCHPGEAIVKGAF